SALTLGEVDLDPADAVPVLVELLRDPETLVRLSAADALGHFGPAAAPAADALRRGPGRVPGGPARAPPSPSPSRAPGGVARRSVPVPPAPWPGSGPRRLTRRASSGLCAIRRCRCAWRPRPGSGNSPTRRSPSCLC